MARASSSTIPRWRNVRPSEVGYVVLGLFMLSYILRFPATYKIGWIDGQMDLYQRLESVPEEFWLELEQIPWVKWAHTLPVTMWLALSIIQLVTKQYGFYTVHRILGRVFGVVSFIIWLGLWYMAYMNAGLFIPAVGRTITCIYNIWFGLTMAKAFYHARRKEIATHRKWITRHLWSGMSPVVQRIYIMVVYRILKAVGYEISTLQLFTNSALVCFLLTPVFCELGLYLTDVLATRAKQQ